MNNESIIRNITKNNKTPGMPVRSFLLGYINVINNKIQASGDRLFEEISWRQEFTLRCISFFDKPPTLNEVALIQATTRQNVKQVVSRLEEKGYVTTVQDEEDLRKTRIYMTKKAWDIFEKYAGTIENLCDGLFEEVAEEDLEATMRVLGHMYENL